MSSGAAGAAVSPSEAVVRVVGVSLTYGRTLALDDVSFALPAGEMVGFIGPDGVGKSSLLALISGARQAQSGEIFALGGDMRSALHRELVCPRIAYMPQGLGKNLYADLSVSENVDFFGRLFGQARAERERRIAELLEATELSAFADRPAGKLSGGMRQKLGLCCCLIHDPDLLILDEPTTGVDPLSRRQFWDLIERMRARRPGMSVIVATGYMEEAERFDWLVAMNAGKVLATGRPADVRGDKASLEDAFIELLPEAMRRGHRQLILTVRTPFSEGPDVGVFAADGWRMADLGAKHALLLAGVGWGNMPEPNVREDLAAGRLVRLELPEARSVAYSFQAMYRTDTPPGPAAAWLIQRLADQAG